MLEVVHLGRLGESLVTGRRHVFVWSCHTISWIFYVRCSFRTALQSKRPAKREIKNNVRRYLVRHYYSDTIVVGSVVTKLQCKR